MNRRTMRGTALNYARFRTPLLVGAIGVFVLAGCSGSENVSDEVTAGQSSSTSLAETLVETQTDTDDDQLVVSTTTEPAANGSTSKTASSGTDGDDVITEPSVVVTSRSNDSPTSSATSTGSPTSSTTADGSIAPKSNSSAPTTKSETTQLPTRSDKSTANPTVATRPTTVKPTTTKPTTTRPTTTKPTTTQPVARPGSGAFFSVNFQQSQIGTYTDARIRADWDNIHYTNGTDGAEILQDGQNRFVRVEYPKGQVGNDGATWAIRLGSNSSDELYASYRIRFVGDFNPVLGGKLPGLAGGARNTGGDKPTGRDGWSARIMWRRDNAAVQYLYHPDQPSKWGEDLKWGRTFPKNQWVTVETRVKMNTPGQKNGIVQSWMNGQRTLNRTDIRFRDVDSFGVDSFLFSTFFGGSGSEWAPTKDEYIDFDDFIISDSPITH